MTKHAHAPTTAPVNTGMKMSYMLVDTGRPAEAAAKIRAMTLTHVNGKKVLARGLVPRRAEESAPFQAAAKAAAVAKNK